MAKFSGLVCYITQEEFPLGVWTDIIVPVPMKGDVIRQSSTNKDDGKVNGNIALNHRVSLIGDSKAFSQYYNIKWIEVDGYKWEVNSVEIQRPRIIVTLGGLWNG